MLVSFPGSLDTSQKDSVGTSGSTESKLVKGEGLTACSDDALAGCLRETEGSDGEFWDGGQADVIGHGADLNNDLGRDIGGVGGFFGDTGEGKRGTVGLREEEAVEDSL